MNQLTPYLLLIRRLASSGRLAAGLVMPFVVASVFTAMFLVSNGFALSGRQSAQSELGRFDFQAGNPIPMGAAAGHVVTAVSRGMQAAGTRDFAIDISSPSARPDSVAGGFTSGAQRVYDYEEMADPSRDFPGHYRLVSGRWPTIPGEVLITPVLRRELEGRVFTAFSRRATFTIVGVVSDTFSTDAKEIVAAPGTWRTIPARRGGEFDGSAQLAVSWSGGPSLTQVDQLLRRVIPGSYSASEVAVDNLIRSKVVASRDKTLLDSMRLLFAYPLIALSLMVGVGVFRTNRRWMTVYADRLSDIGLGRRPVAVMFAAMLAVGTAVSFCAGIAVGIGAGAAIRSWALPHVLTQPLGPMRSLTPIVVAGALMLAAAVASALLSLAPSGSAGSAARRLVAVVPWALLRRVLGVVVLVRAVTVAGDTTTSLDSKGATLFLMLAATVLFAPELLLLGSVCLSRGRPRPLVARRLIHSDRGGLAVVAVLVAACVAIPATMGSYEATQVRTEASEKLSLVPAHQIWIDGGSTTTPLRYATAVAQALPGTRQIELEYTSAYSNSSSASQVNTTAVETVASGRDLKVVFGHSRSVRAIAKFIDGGGVALWGGKKRGVYTQSGTAPPVKVPLRVRAFPGRPSSYQVPFAAIMLASTARRIHLATRLEQVILPGLSNADIHRAVAGVSAAGLDTTIAEFHIAPPRTRPTADWYFALGGLLVVAGFLLVSLMRAAGELMRERAAQLLAIGFRRRWSAGVAVLQLGLATLSGMVAAVAGSVAGVKVLASAHQQGLVLDIPYGFIGWTVALVVALSLTGILASVRAVRASTAPVD